ncbi:MAG: hypothetical protein KAF91_27280 [Nostoc sp. TH1S01]|nr:hypothetical protein [Nostoc sp. TH1S01]
MVNINASKINPAGSELFTDAENFLEDLTDTEAMAVQGGEGDLFLPYIAFGQKFLEYGVNGFAIANIASIAKSFSAAGAGAGAGGAGGAGAGGAGAGAGGVGGGGAGGAF